MRHCFILLLTLLSACSTVPPRAPVADIEQAWKLHQQTLTPLNNWSLSARIAIRANDDGWHGTLLWQQQKSQYTIQFIAPLGQGTLQLSSDQQHGAKLLAEDKTYRADSAEELLHRHLGWHFPVDALRYWVVGLPYPTSEKNPEQRLDPYGRLEHLQQGGWKVEFKRYGQVGELELPEKIFISNHRLNLRLIVEQWERITS